MFCQKIGSKIYTIHDTVLLETLTYLHILNDINTYFVHV